VPRVLRIKGLLQAISLLTAQPHSTNIIDCFTDDRLVARELRDAAYHEAGHKALYEYFGGAGDAVVWRNESRNPGE